MKSPLAPMVVAILAGALACPAAADEAAPPAEKAVAFTLGARASVAFPMGSILSDSQNGDLRIDELVALSIPLQLDAGVTLHGRWFVGAYVQYAWSVLQLGGCKVGESCSVTGVRAGVQATWSLRPRGGPWVGLGTGYEWMFTSYSGPGFDTRVDVGGWEWAIVQLGWDVELSPGWKVGPWASGSVGEFSRDTVWEAGKPTQSSIPNKAVHGWLQLGVKGSFTL
ncbi:MAG: autotransporter domain-containing protein [Anaeromyxobacteraceae bacterium]